MDRKELIQEIEKRGLKLLQYESGVVTPESGEFAFHRVATLFMLHQLEKDKEREDQMMEMVERLAPALEKMTADESDASRKIRHDLMSQLYDANLTLRDLSCAAMKHFVEGTGGLNFDLISEKLANAGEYDGEVMPIGDVDWKAVHACEIRAPRYVEHPQSESWEKGVWIYIDQDGTSLFDEAHVIALGYVDASIAAIYRFCEDGSAWLYWQRRFLYTAQMTKEQINILKEKMR
jgi:hypothetical protein